MSQNSPTFHAPTSRNLVAVVLLVSATVALFLLAVTMSVLSAAINLDGALPGLTYAVAGVAAVVAYIESHEYRRRRVDAADRQAILDGAVGAAGDLHARTEDRLRDIERQMATVLAAIEAMSETHRGLVKGMTRFASATALDELSGRAASANGEMVALRRQVGDMSAKVDERLGAVEAGVERLVQAVTPPAGDGAQLPDGLAAQVYELGRRTERRNGDGKTS
jgi:uncharacterized membrane protein HdeD (DUF308 family)